jgi:hypothetical protein
MQSLVLPLRRQNPACPAGLTWISACRGGPADVARNGRIPTISAPTAGLGASRQPRVGGASAPDAYLTDLPGSGVRRRSQRQPDVRAAPGSARQMLTVDCATPRCSAISSVSSPRRWSRSISATRSAWVCRSIAAWSARPLAARARRPVLRFGAARRIIRSARFVQGVVASAAGASGLEVAARAV